MENKERQTIFIVDDQVKNLQLLGNLLKEEGYHVVAIQSGLEVFKLLEKKQPDLILLDIMMPEMDGITVCKKIKSHEEYKELTVIFLTAVTDDVKKLEGFAVGGTDYITKPFVQEEVLARINVILEREQIKKDLAKSEKKWYTLLSHLPDNVISVNRYGDIVYLGTGISENYESGNFPKNLFDIVSDKNKVKFEAALKKIIETGEEVKIEYMDNDYRWYMSRFVTLNTVIENFEVMIIITDITTQKQAELTLKEHIEIKNNFIANVSHELRTPMASILGFAGTIIRDKDMEKETKEEFIKIIFNESKRLSRLIENVLDIAKIDAGKYKMVRKKINLEKIIVEVIETLSSKADSRQIGLNYSIENDIPEIEAAPDEMKEVVINLIDNAIKYTDPKGEIDVRLEVKNTFLQLSVKDDGIGIAKEDVGKIYDKFFRVENTKRESQGTGLGLAIVKEFISQHNGTIDIETEPGKGSTFIVKLPLSI